MSPFTSGPHLVAKFWILDPIYTAMGTVLAWFYSIVASYGLAIALLTIAVRVLLIPLTTKQVKSQQAMQRIQPELKRLQAKYKDDRQKLNEEMMKFYKENKVNPVAGCLPLLLQTPLFLVLYRLILGLTHRPEPKHLPRSSQLYQSLLESGGKMVSWGIDLARSASSQKGLGNAWPYYVLVVITVATGFYQQRQMTARMPAGSTNAQMKMIGRVFPAMIGLISLSIPAGVVVYFIVSNIWQIAQQEVTFRTLGSPSGEKPVPKSERDRTKPDGSAGDAGGGKNGKTGKAGKTGGGSARNTRPGAGGGGRGGNRPANGKQPPKPGKQQPSKPGKQQPSSKQNPASKQNPSSSGRGGAKPGSPGGRAEANGSARAAKGKRPPPSPRPKGLPKTGPGPGPGANGSDGPSAKNTPPRKDV
jgi:YidC/Oxa1 family membrane protein insertase